MIVLYPDPILREKCPAVKSGDEELVETINLLKKTLQEAKTGIGLAAPQVGRRQRVFLIKELTCYCEDSRCQKDHFQVFINPQIVDYFNQEKVFPKILNENGQEEPFLEGCLSFPHLYGPVKRWLKIKVSYQVFNRQKGELQPKTEILEDLPAIVFQHELDHLDGILFIDHIKREKEKLFREEKGKLKPIRLASITSLFSG